MDRKANEIVVVFQEEEKIAKGSLLHRRSIVVDIPHQSVAIGRSLRYVAKQSHTLPS